MADATLPDYPGVVPHLWLGGFVPGEVPEAPFTENILSYVERNDLTVVLSAWNTTDADARRLDDDLQTLRDRDIDVWLGTYDLRDYTDEELATDEDDLSADTERLLRMVDVYADHYPDGAVFTWHEPPNTGQWTGETYQERARSMVEYGPDIYAYQKAAVAEHHPDLDFGLMLWWHIVPPAEYSHAPIVEPLMDGLADRDAVPDFVYFDFYRGYYEWDGGHEGVNDVIRASIENVKATTDDRPVYYLGQCHSINNRFTPSKQSIVGDLRTALEAGVDSYGWYIRKGYRETHPRSYDPFVPNHGSGQYEEWFNTVVGSRDRFVWSFQALLERVRGVDPTERFDLWLHGHDLNFYEHAVEVRTSDGEWEFLGDVSGYLDGNERYSGADRDSVAAFHGLERDRFPGDELAVRIGSADDGDGATLHGVYAVPHLDAAHYLTEPELAGLVDERSDLGRYSLGAAEPDVGLTPGSETRVDVSLDDPTADLRELARPEQRETFEALGELEADPEFAPSDRFDLWLYGADVRNATVQLGGTPIEGYAADAGAAGARVYRGLERDSFFDRNSAGNYLDLAVTADAPAELRAAFAVPYHGTVNFATDADVARIVERDYAVGGGEGQLTGFSLGHQTWPDGAELDAGERVATWLHLSPRRLRLAAE